MGKLPRYTDDEVRVFHPLFESALVDVISELGLSDELEVKHHWSTRGFSGIIDFVVLNRHSNKVLLPIEIKKTPVDLFTQGRRQCRGYLENLGSFRGSDFYLTSNLEFVELFKDSPERRLTEAQKVHLELGSIGQFAESSYEGFVADLKESLKEVLGIVSGNDGTRYSSNISGLIHALQATIRDETSWRQAMQAYLFEFLVGAKSTDESTAKAKNRPWGGKSGVTGFDSSLSHDGFEEIFEPKALGRFNSEELKAISAGSRQEGELDESGVTVASVVNELVEAEFPARGIVETSTQVAQVLALELRALFPHGFQAGKKLFDVGAGTGNLLVAASQHLPELEAQQIMAIESQSNFREALTLRLGRAFRQTLSNDNKPDIRIDDLGTLTPRDCIDVGAAILNPPFIRGIDAVTDKRLLEQAHSGFSSEGLHLNSKQLGYECSFIEYLLEILPEGAHILTVFPTNSLTRPDAEAVRKFLVERFGLKKIVTYKSINLFGGAQKETVVLVGQKNKVAEVIEVTRYVEELDLDNFASANGSPTQQIESEVFKREDFGSTATIGWKRFLSPNSKEYLEFEKQLISKGVCRKVSEVTTPVRGNAGNKGLSEFIFNARKSKSQTLDDMPDIWKGVPETWITPAVKNSDGIPRFINSLSGEAGLLVLQTPENLATAKNLMSQYREMLAKEQSGIRATKQRKNSKTTDEMVEALTSTTRFSGNLVLLPRGSRATAQISMSDNGKDGLIVSTNFFTVALPNEKETLALASWFLSIFGQLQFEFLGINENGLRKLEKLQIDNCLIPDFSSLHTGKWEELELAFSESEAIVFRDLKTRPIDNFWASQVFGIHGKQVLEQANALLGKLVAERIGGGV